MKTLIVLAERKKISNGENVRIKAGRKQWK